MRQKMTRAPATPAWQLVTCSNFIKNKFIAFSIPFYLYKSFYGKLPTNFQPTVFTSKEFDLYKFFCTPFTFYKNLYGKLCLLTFIRVGTENTFSHILPKGFYLDMGLCTTFTFIRVSMENCVPFYLYKGWYGNVLLL